MLVQDDAELQEAELDLKVRRDLKKLSEKGGQERLLCLHQRVIALKQMTQELMPNTWEAPVCCMAVTQPSLAESENSPGLPTATEEESPSHSHMSDSPQRQS